MLDEGGRATSRTSSRPRSSASGATASSRSAPTCASGCAARPRTTPARAVALRARVRPAERSRRGSRRRSAAPVDARRGLRLRGSIDLVERDGDGRLRVTDHKTGKERVARGRRRSTAASALQPVLYALAAEKLFPGAPVESGRLYYCTSAGGFAEREVPLDDAARARGADAWRRRSARALDERFLPAAPARAPAAGATTARVRALRGAARRAQDQPEPLARAARAAGAAVSAAAAVDRRRRAPPDRRAPRRDALRRGRGRHRQDDRARGPDRRAAAQRPRAARPRWSRSRSPRRPRAR